MDAYSSGTMVRLIEKYSRAEIPAMPGHSSGVCGVCTTVHSLVSCRSVEDALGIVIPPNAEIVRNLMYCAQYMHDHVVLLPPPCPRLGRRGPKCASGDPKATSELAQSISNWPQEFAGLFFRLAEAHQRFVESGQLGIFANGYWGTLPTNCRRKST